MKTFEEFKNEINSLFVNFDVQLHFQDFSDSEFTRDQSYYVDVVSYRGDSTDLSFKYYIEDKTYDDYPSLSESMACDLRDCEEYKRFMSKKNPESFSEWEHESVLENEITLELLQDMFNAGVFKK